MSELVILIEPVILIELVILSRRRRIPVFRLCIRSPFDFAEGSS